MSAIDEALKRARADAARRSAAERGAASRWVPSLPLTRPRRRPWLWAGIAGACLVAGVAVGLAVAGLIRDSGREVRALTAVETPAVVEEEAQVGSKGSGGLTVVPAAKAERPAAPGGARSAAAPREAPPPAPREARQEEPRPGTPTARPVPPAPLEPAHAAEARHPSPSPPSSSSRPVRPTPPAPEAATHQAAPSPPSPSSAALPAADPSTAPPPVPRDAAAAAPEAPAPTYVRRARLPGGGEIALGGIAFSTNPVALLNGKVVGVGEVVDGMTVVAIVPGRVELEGRGTRLALTIE